MQQLHFGGCISVQDSFACDCQTIGLNRCVNEANTVLHKGLTSYCVVLKNIPVWHFIAQGQVLSARDDKILKFL